MRNRPQKKAKKAVGSRKYAFIGFRPTEATLQRLREVSGKTGMKISEVVRRCIDRGISDVEARFAK